MNPKSTVSAVLLSLVLAASLPAQARQYEMFVPAYQPLQTSSGAAPTAAYVKAAILDAANSRRWEVVATEPGKLTLRYAPRTHEVVIAVRYDDRGYKIEYVSSRDMDYQVKRGKTYIHGNYNVWIGNLSQNIDASRVLLLDEAVASPPATTVANAPLRTLTLKGPVRINATVPYRAGFVVPDDIRTQCSWNSRFSDFMADHSDGLVEITDADLDTLSGYTLKLSVLNLHTAVGGGFSGPKWATLRADLYENGQLIGRTEQRRATQGMISTACGALTKVADAIAEDTVAWLRQGRFEVIANPNDALREIGPPEQVPSIQ